MAERIIDVLEPVEIEHEDRKPLAQPALAGARFLDLLGEQGAVGEPGERVVMRHVGDPRVGLGALGHILEHGQQILRLAIAAR